MNIDKYWETNIVWVDFIWLDKYEEKRYWVYLDFIWKIDSNSNILEIWAWNGSFSFFLKKQFQLKNENISTLDISESVVNNLKNNNLTKDFNNNLSDTIEFLSKNEEKFDLIVLRHVIEHMKKDYIIKLVPVIIKSLKNWWKILIETPNLVNMPLWISLYFWDFSHFTWFTEKSLKECFIWNTDEDIDIKFYNLYLILIDYSSILKLIKTFIANILYRLYVNLLLFIYKFANLPFKIWTTSIIAVITRK